jgi:hypothetical protein
MEPYPVPEPPQQFERAQPPRTVLSAVRFMYAGAALEVVALIVALVTRGSLKSAILPAHPHYTPAQLHCRELPRQHPGNQYPERGRRMAPPGRRGVGCGRVRELAATPAKMRRGQVGQFRCRQRPVRATVTGQGWVSQWRPRAAVSSAARSSGKSAGEYRQHCGQAPKGHPLQPQRR